MKNEKRKTIKKKKKKQTNKKHVHTLETL